MAQHRILARVDGTTVYRTFDVSDLGDEAIHHAAMTLVTNGYADAIVQREEYVNGGEPGWVLVDTFGVYEQAAA